MFDLKTRDEGARLLIDSGLINEVGCNFSNWDFSYEDIELTRHSYLKDGVDTTECFGVSRLLGADEAGLMKRENEKFFKNPLIALKHFIKRVQKSKEKMNDSIKAMAHQTKMKESDLEEIIMGYMTACKNRNLTDEETMNMDNMVAYLLMMVKFNQSLLDDESKMRDFQCEVLDLVMKD